jgi:hypothetical protein
MARSALFAMAIAVNAVNKEKVMITSWFVLGLGLISGFFARHFFVQWKRKKALAAEASLSPIFRTLKNLDAVGGSGFLLKRNELGLFLDPTNSFPMRRQLADALKVSEAVLVDEMSSYMRAGGTEFACLALIDMYLAD